MNLHAINTRCLLIALALLTACGKADGIEPADKVVPREDWDRPFQRAEGWTGGDVAAAIDLGQQRTLWLWGDTWIGRVEQGKHASGSRLVNNSLAIHVTPADGAAPDPSDVQFVWGAKNSQGEPTAWLVPDRSRVTPRLPKAATSEATWYWLVEGIVAPSREANPRLLLFAWHMGRTKGTGVWNFATVGGTLAIVDNPAAPLDTWHVVQHDIPHAQPDAVRETVPPGKSIQWGVALLLVPRDEATTDAGSPWLYIYGTRAAGGFNTELVLARAPADSVEDFSQWRFRTTSGWSERVEELSPLADGLVSEFSVSRVDVGGQARYLLVQSQPLFGTQIVARLNTAPDKPWPAARPIYQVPGVDPQREQFTYAAKAHPHLSRPGKLLITYLINSHNFAKAVADANIYRPRFVELDMQSFAEP